MTEPIGPDDEIEVLGRQFEAMQLIRNTKMTFEQFIAIQERTRSNAWAYACNRNASTLLVVG